MSDAIAGVGAKFKREVAGGSSAEPYDAIAEIKSIGGPEMSRETIDVTSLDSTGGYREFLASFRDGGVVTLEMNFTRAGWEDMLTDFQSDTAVNYQIVIPDAGETTLDFAALVTRLGLSITTEDAVTAPVTLKITGQVNMTS